MTKNLEKKKDEARETLDSLLDANLICAAKILQLHPEEMSLF